MTSLGNIRYTLRQFRLSPAFTATAVLTLALGIGGTTAIFTLINAVMLRSLAVADPTALYRIGEGDDCCVQRNPQDKWGIFSFPLTERLKAAAPEFAEVAAFQAGVDVKSVRRAGSNIAAQPLRSEYVSGNYFSVFGIGALGGRLFTEKDDAAGAPPATVVSHHAWQTFFGGETSVVGSTIAIEGHPFTIVGIAPPRFFGDTLRSDPTDIWIPLHQEPMISGDGNLMNQSVAAWLRVIGRLKPGATVAGMAPRLTGVLRQWMQNESGYPSNWMPDVVRTLSKQVIDVVPAGGGVEVMKQEYARSLRILFWVCALVLLIACANVANLLLVRSVARRGQTALRLAIGATRRQIVLQALAESVLLALGGGVAGLLVAIAADRVLLALAFSTARFLPIDVTPSLPVLGFAVGVSVLTGIIFGAAPAWLATRADPAEALRGQSWGLSDRSSSVSKVLLVCQATLSIVLVAGGTMLGRSLNNLEHQDFGYQTQGRVIVELNAPPASYTFPKLSALYRQIEERLNRMPGVTGSGLAGYNPLTDNWGELVMVAGHSNSGTDNDSGASWNRVSASYLNNFGFQVLRGRSFTEADNENAEPVAVVNQAFVRKFFTTAENPLEQHFGPNLRQNAGTYRIVGVIRDAKFASFGLRRPARPMFFVSMAQNVDYKDELMKGVERRTHFAGGLMLVTSTPPGTLEPLLRRALAEVDPNLTIINVRKMEEQVALTFDEERAVASLASLFGIVALILAAVGMYGVTAYSVARRTPEIGIRMALGADRAKVIGLVLQGASKRVMIGLIAGVPLAIGAGRLITAELYGVSSWDPPALTVAAGALIISTFIAAFIPANRAASISPTKALRAE